MGEYSKPEADVDIAVHAALTKTHGATTKLADTDDVAVHAALTTGVHGVGTDTIGKALVNRLKGLTATLNNFTTAPTNLANITDEDWTTVSGTGSRTCSGTFEPMNVYYDLGAVRTVLLMGKLGLWSSAGNVDASWLSSIDGSTWILAAGVSGAVRGSTSEVISYLVPLLIRGRYIGIRVRNVNTSVTANVKFYELAALEFGDFIGSN
jgi:hypothetical protein